LKWNYRTQEEYYSGVARIFMGHYTSGSATVELPGPSSSLYEFRIYSGTVLDYPVTGDYVMNHVKDVTLVIKKIKVF